MSDPIINVNDVIKSSQKKQKISSRKINDNPNSEYTNEDPRNEISPKRIASFDEAEQLNKEVIHLNGLADHYNHKKGWSWLLGGCIAALTLFQMRTISNVGSGVWSFKDYPSLLPTLMGQYLIQIVALATYVVKCLFDSMNKQPSQEAKRSSAQSKDSKIPSKSNAGAASKSD